jgi:outer membrane protein
MRFGLLRLIMLALSLAVSPAKAASLPLNSQTIRDLVTAKNAKLSAVRFEKSAAEELKGSLARSFLPAVNFYGAQENFKTGSLEQKSQPAFGAEIQVNLFNGGRDKIENEVRSLEVERISSQEQKTAADELQRARAHYWQILFLREKLILLKDAFAVNRRNLASALRRIKSGVAADSDRFEFEMKAVDLKREIAETELEISSQNRLLKNLMALPMATEFEFSEPFKHDHGFEKDLMHSSDQHDYIYKEHEIQAEQRNLFAKRHARYWLPKVDAYWSYSKFNQKVESAGPDANREMLDEFALGLRMTVNLTDVYNSEREAIAFTKKAIAAQAIATFQRQEVEAHLQSEMDELTLLHDQVHDVEENISRAKSYYAMTQAEYSRGVKNSPDVLGASEKLFAMRHKRLEIIKNFQLAKSHVLSKLGK